MNPLQDLRPCFEGRFFTTFCTKQVAPTFRKGRTQVNLEEALRSKLTQFSSTTTVPTFGTSGHLDRTDLDPLVSYLSKLG